MEEVLKLVEEWAGQNAEFVNFIGSDAETFVFIFETGLNEKHTFQVLFDQNWSPLFISANEPSLHNWVDRMNTYIERKGVNSLSEILKEARKSLMLLWKIEEPDKEKPSETSSYNYQPIYQESYRNPIGSPVPYPFGQNYTPWDSVDIAPPEKREDPRTTESIRKEISEWIAGHEGILTLRQLNDMEYKLLLSIGDPPMDFEIICDDQWNLKGVFSDNVSLILLVPLVNTYISDAHPSLSTFCTHFSLVFKKDGENMLTVEEIQQALGDAAEKLQNIDEEPKVDPTSADWEETILPSIQNYLTVDNLESWQIGEWMRSIRLKLTECSPQNYKPCLEFIMDNLFQGGEVPPNIRKFFQKPQPYYIRRQQSHWKYPKGATEYAKKRLEKEFKNISTMNSKLHGFVAKPIRNNLFHWTISLFDFDRHSTIHQELVHFTLNSDPENPSIVSETGMVNAVDILFEVKFPADYPNGSPLFRLIRPRFMNLDEGLFDFDFSAVPKDEDGSDVDEDDTVGSNSITNNPVFPMTTTTTTTSDSTPTPENFTYTTTPTTTPIIHEPTPPTKPTGLGTMSTLEKPHARLPHPMSVSMTLEKQDWKKMPKIFDFAVHLRQNILNSNFIHIDINSSKEGIPTEGSFWQEYKCMSLSDIDHRPESDVGGKIYLPPGSLSEIMDTDRYGGYGFLLRDRGRGSPMIFEISSKSGLRSFCGVLEFIAPEGCVGVPSWMMEHLSLTKGQPVQIRKVHLPKGIYVKLQPHTGEFNKTEDIKATLEWVLRRFVALSVGDTIEVEHDHVRLKFNVLECTPDRAIAITDQDVSVDFVTALDGKDIKPQNQDTENEESMNIAPDSVTVGQMNPQGVEGVDYILCSNCHQPVPPAAISMHVMRCERINWFCDLCKIPLLKTDTAAHNEKFHTRVVCEVCDESMEKRFISEHKKSMCPLRIVSCQFCKLKMQYRKIWSHEQSCGSVTEVCTKCNNRYPRRELDSHSQSCSGATPPPYKSVPRIPKPSNDLMLCEKCNSPFSTFDELQVHILTSHVEELHDFPGLFGGFSDHDPDESKEDPDTKGDSGNVKEAVKGDSGAVKGDSGAEKGDSGLVGNMAVEEDAGTASQETDMVDYVDADNAAKVVSVCPSGSKDLMRPKTSVMEPLPLPTRTQWEGNLTGKEKKQRKAVELEDFEVASDDE